MECIIYIYAFVIGCCLASFTNVIIDRLPRHQTFIKGRSYCPYCHHQLNALDLIPIVSYLFLKGHCRYCQHKIPYKDTIVELFGGCLAIFCLRYHGLHWMALLSFIFIMTLFAIAFIDWKTMIIPDCLIVIIFIIGILSYPFLDIKWVDRIIGFFILSLPMSCLNKMIPDCFGGGDIKLLAVSGVIMGWQKELIAMFIAVVSSSIYATFLLCTHKLTKNDHIAFGPYLSLGMTIAYFYGASLYTYYLSFFIV